VVGRPVGVLRTRRRTERAGGWEEGEVDGGWVSAGETVLIDSEEPPSRRSKPGGPAPGPLSFLLCPSSVLSLARSRAISLLARARANPGPFSRDERSSALDTLLTVIRRGLLLLENRAENPS
jgi:hypothetical protein